MHKFATGSSAVCAIAAGWHVRVAEGAVRVCAVGVEFAVDFVLEMLSALSWRGMFTRTLLVFAGRTEGAAIGKIDCGAWWGRGGLVSIRTCADCAFVVEATESVERILALGAAVLVGSIHVHRAVACAHASVVNVLAIVLCTAIWVFVDSFEKAFASAPLLLSKVLHVRWLTIEHLRHHLALHLHHLQELHLLLRVQSSARLLRHHVLTRATVHHALHVVRDTAATRSSGRLASSMCVDATGLTSSRTLNSP